VQGFDKKRIALLIFLVSIGSVLLGIGFKIIIEGDIAYTNDIKSPKLMPIPIHEEKNTVIADATMILSTVHFDTHDVFSVNNPVNFTIIVFVTNPNQYDVIHAFPFAVYDNMEIQTTSQIIDDMNKGIKFTTFDLDRNRSDNSFRVTIINHNFTSEQKLGFLLIPVSKGVFQNSTFILDKSPLMIYPATAELQAQTDRDIQRQNIESARTNSHVEGLTFVIISLVPLGIFMETIVHRFLTDYGKNNYDL
jgi:hypothetical protein